MKTKNVIIISNQRHLDEIERLHWVGALKLDETMLVIIRKKSTSIDERIIQRFDRVQFSFDGGFYLLISLLKLSLWFRFNQLECENVFISVNDYQTITFLNKIRFERLNIFDDGIGVIKLWELVCNGDLHCRRPSSPIADFVLGVLGARYSFKFTSKTPVRFFSRFHKLLTENARQNFAIVPVKSVFDSFKVRASSKFYFIGQPMIESLGMESALLSRAFDTIKRILGEVYYLPHPSEKETKKIALQYFDECPEFKTWGVFLDRRMLPSKISGFYSTVLYDVVAVDHEEIDARFFFHSQFEKFMGNESYRLMLGAVPIDKLVMIDEE